MKDLKNYLVLTSISLLTGILFFACSNETVEDSKIESANLKTALSNKTTEISKNTEKLNLANIALSTGCSYIDDNNPAIITLTPPTLAKRCSLNAQAQVGAGTSSSYKFIVNDILTYGQWSVYSGSGITFNSGTLTASGSTVTVNFSPNFVSGSIKVNGQDETGQDYGPILNFTKTGGTVVGGGGDCACPNPVIKTNLTNEGAPITNTHPYYRLELQNLQSGDTYVWSGKYMQFMAGVNDTYVIIKPLVPVDGIFEVYCTVTRVCSNGTIKKRKALYRNFLGGNQSTAYTSFINLGTACDTPLD